MENDKKSRFERRLAFWDKATFWVTIVLFLFGCWRVWALVSPNTAPATLFFIDSGQWTWLGAVSLITASIGKMTCQDKLEKMVDKED